MRKHSQRGVISGQKDDLPEMLVLCNTVILIGSQQHCIYAAIYPEKKGIIYTESAQ